MEKYKTLMEMNRKIVFGEEIPDTEKEQAVSILLNGICDKEEGSFDLFKDICRKQIYFMLIIMNWKLLDYFICLSLKIKLLMKW